MEAKDLRKLNWVHVEDWSMLMATTQNRIREFRIGLKDINDFVNYTIREISRKLNLEFSQVAFQIRSENEEVLAYVNTALKGHCFTDKDTEILKFKAMFVIPQISYSAENIAEMYDLLNEEEKIKFRKLVD